MNSNIQTSSADSVGAKLFQRIKKMASRQCFFTISLMVLLFSIVTFVISKKSHEHASTKLNLIIDTDAGSDDAMALFMFLRAEKNAKLEKNEDGPEILAITCVNGNTRVENVVINVLKVLKEVNRLDIPVYIGARSSLHWTPEIDDFFGSDGMGDVPMPDPPSIELAQSEHAVNALITLVNERPGEITIVTLGPLTNIALAIRLDPNFLTKIKKIIILGGSVEGKGNMLPGVEFNFYVDPEANYVVLNDTIFKPNSVMIMPLDAVMAVEVSKEWRVNTLGVLNSPEIIFMNKVEHIEDYDLNTMWEFADALAAAIVLNESLIGDIKSYGVQAITSGPTRGGLVVDTTDILQSKSKIGIAYYLSTEGYKNSLLHLFS